MSILEKDVELDFMNELQGSGFMVLGNQIALSDGPASKEQTVEVWKAGSK